MRRLALRGAVLGLPGGRCSGALHGPSRHWWQTSGTSPWHPAQYAPLFTWAKQRCPRGVCLSGSSSRGVSVPAEHVAVCRSVGNEPPSLPSVSSPPPLPSGKRRVAGVGIPPQWEGTPRKRDLRRAPPPADCPLFGARCCPRAASEHRGAGVGPSAPPCQPCLCPR